MAVFTSAREAIMFALHCREAADASQLRLHPRMWPPCAYIAARRGLEESA